MINNVNDQLGNKGAYLKTKAFGLVFMWTGHLIESGWFFLTNKQTKRVRQLHFSQKFLSKLTQKPFFELLGPGCL